LEVLKMSSDGAANGSVQGWPELELPARLLRPPLGARVQARLRSRTLDRRLARGVDPDGGPALAARAAYLTRRCTRERIAEDIERFVEYAERAPSRVTVAPARTAVHANRDELRCLAETLRGPSPVYARGIAELVVLLGDGTGPAYCDRRGEALARRVRGVQTALRG
jgi:hypothetical protein